MLRCAGHDFMDYRKDDNNKGGADGCINFNDGDNAGLDICLPRFTVNDLLANHKDEVSLADFIYIGAEALLIRTSLEWDEEDPYREGTMGFAFLKGFKYGRKTANKCSWN